MSDAALDVAGARLRYRCDGPLHAPLVVLANSLGTDLSLWEGQIPVLTRRFRVLRYDLRGHGGSTVSAVPVDLARLGRDALSLLDELAAPRAHFCGLSLGGMIALWVASAAPERVEKIVLANTAAVLGPPSFWDSRVEAVRRGGVEAIAGSVLERWFSEGFRAAAPEVVELARRRLLGTDARGYVAACLAIRDMDQRESVNFVRSRALVVTGKYDQATPPSAGQWLAAHLPWADYVELPAAHLSNIEAEQAFNQAVLGFLMGTESNDG